MKTCPECLHANPPEADRCESCGLVFEASSQPEIFQKTSGDAGGAQGPVGLSNGDEAGRRQVEPSEDPNENMARLTSALNEAEARGDWAAALQILSEISSLSQDRAGLVDKRLELERLLEEQRRQDDWQAAENRRQDRVEDFLKAGRDRLDRRLWSEAAAAFQNVLELEAGQVEATQGAALAEEQRARLADLKHEADEGERKGDLERALRALTIMIPLSPDQDRVTERRDRIQRRLEEERLAEERKQSESARQAEIEAQLGLGRMEFKNCRWPEAATAFERVLDLTGQDEEARLLLERSRNYQAKVEQLTVLADQAEAEGDLEKAVFALEEMQPLLPEDAPIRARLTKLTQDLSHHQKSAKVRIEEERRLARIQHILDQGLDKMRSRDYAGATHLFEQVVRLDETNQEARELLARIENNLGRLHELSRAAEAASGLGRFDEAVDLLRELLEITTEPEAVAARLVQAEARLADARRTESRKAEQDQRRAESGPEVERGKQYVRARSWGKAAASFRRALELDPDNGEARELLAKTETCRKRLANLAETAKAANRNGDLDGAINAMEQMKPLVSNVDFIQEKIDDLIRRQEEALQQDEPQVESQDQRRQERCQELVSEGERQFNNKHWSSAIGILAQALRLDTDHEEANRFFERAHVNLERLEELWQIADQAEAEGRLSEAVEALEASLPLLADTTEALGRKDRLEQQIEELAQGEAESWSEPRVDDDDFEGEGPEAAEVPERLEQVADEEAGWSLEQEPETEETWPPDEGPGPEYEPAWDESPREPEEPSWEAGRVELGRELSQLIPKGRRKVWIMWGVILLVLIAGLVWSMGNFEPKAPAEVKPAAAPAPTVKTDQAPPATPAVPSTPPAPQELAEVDLTFLFKALAGTEAAKALPSDQLSSPPAGLSADHPAWPQYLYLLGEVYRLRGDLKQAAQSWQTLVDWAAGPAANNSNLAGTLPLAALWRLLESTGPADAAGAEQVKALQAKLTAIKSAGLVSPEEPTPDLADLPQFKSAVYGYLTTLAWQAGDQPDAQTLAEEYLAAGDPEKFNVTQQEALKSLVKSGSMTEGGLLLKTAGRLEALRKYGPALKVLAEAGEKGTDSEKQAAALRRGVLLSRSAAKPEQALEILDPLAGELKDDGMLQEALYYRALQFMREGPQKDPERYVKELAALAERFPSGRFSDDALLRQGVYYLDRGQTEPALAAFKALRDFAVPNDYEDSARYRPAMALYTRGQPGDLDEAYKLLEDLIRARPTGPLKRTAMFWLGRIAEESGRDTDAKRWFTSTIEELPYDFYANRARMHLNQGAKADALLWPDDQTMADLRTAFDKGRVPQDIAGASPAHVRLRQALKAGLYQEAVAAEKELRLKFPDTQNRFLDLGDLDKSGLLPQVVLLSSLRQDAYLARAADPAVENRLAIAAAIGRGAGDWLNASNLLWSPREPWDVQSAVQRHADYPAVAYPDVYKDVIEKTAEKYQLPPELLYGVIRLESGFYPAALSSASALGLFQFMPKVFDTLDERWKILADHGEKDRTEYLLNPDRNIDLGGRWFAEELLPRTGNMLWALAEHNAGYGAVKRWIAQWKKLGRENDVEYMVETIDYTETKGFSKEVLNGIAMAKSIGLFPASPPSQPSTGEKPAVN